MKATNRYTNGNCHSGFAPVSRLSRNTRLNSGAISPSTEVSRLTSSTKATSPAEPLSRFCTKRSTPGRLPSHDWLLALLASAQPLSRDERRALLSGRAPIALPSPGRIICSCFCVGLNQIRDAVRGGCASVDDVGRTVRAGSNCGSCRAEIKGVIDETRMAEAAAS